MNAMRLICFLGLCFSVNAAVAGPVSGLQSLKGPAPQIESKDPNITYDFNLDGEKFFVRFPTGYNGVLPSGLLVFLSPADEFVDLPPGWAGVLDKNKLIFVAPQSVGNKQPTGRRAGIAVVAARKLQEIAKIDPKRIYVGGFSGGARIAAYTAFAHPELFRGVLDICGSEFPGKVEKVKATEKDEYGSFVLDEARIESARQQVKFTIVTGAKDFRYGNLLDIYRGGYEKNGYAAKLIDVPGMGHAICSDKQLAEALTFLDSPLVQKK
ncbi:MAG: hypothetical protein WCO94_04345 [Verrucomicrobiota bacterium]